MLTIGYGRVSTQEQAQNTGALENQLDQLKRHGVDRIYSDVESGAKPDRWEFKEVTDLIAHGGVSTVVVVSLDRLARDEGTSAIFIKLLLKHNVRLVALDQGEVDLTTAFGKLSANIRFIFAAFEHDVIVERVKRGHQARRNRKEAWSDPPFGYMTVGRHYELDHFPCLCPLESRPANYLELYILPDDSAELLSWDKARIAREIIDYYLHLRRPAKVIRRLQDRFGAPVKRRSSHKSRQGKKQVSQTSGMERRIEERPQKIDKGLFLFGTVSGLKRWLRNPVLRGHIGYFKYPRRGSLPDPADWVIHSDTHTEHRLISDEEYAEIEATLDCGTNKPGKANSIFYLTGKVICSQCQSKCVLKRASNGPAYYGCRHSSTYCGERKCVSLDKIDEAIINTLAQKAREFAQKDKQSITLTKSDRVLQYEKQLQDLESLEWGRSDRLLMTKRKELEKKINKEMNKTRQIELQMMCHPQASKINFWYTLTQSQRENFYHKLVDKVLIRDGEVISVHLFTSIESTNNA